MNAPAKIEAAAEVVPFNAYAAYQRERDWSRTLEQRLSKACMFMEFEIARRDRCGQDAEALRSLLRECQS